MELNYPNRQYCDTVPLNKVVQLLGSAADGCQGSNRCRYIVSPGVERV